MRILVIRLGALGDLFLSFPAFAAIRAHHQADEITLLTTAPYAELCASAPWFDRIAIDARPAPWNLPGLVRLARTLRGHDFVYDLQTSRRSSRYHALAGRPSWSGIAPGATHPDSDPGRNALHTHDRQAGQLARAGIVDMPAPRLDWLAGPAPAFLDTPYVMLVPGAAPHRPAKRWPAASFRALAEGLAADGLVPVIVGAASDRALGAEIAAGTRRAIDLTGRTGIRELAAIAAHARLAVGNDTGPMHVAATLGCPSLVLFGTESDPALTAPRGPAAVVVRRAARLADIAVDSILADARALIVSH